MRIAALLIAIALLVFPIATARAETTPPAETAAGSLSGADVDAERTMQGMVDAHAQELVSKWLRANPGRDLTLRLDSPGGSAKFGLMLYTAIGAHGRVSTDVAPGQSCLSACAFIWLGGKARTMGERAVLGFHSAFCKGPCDPRAVATVNQVILDILAHTEPTLAVLLSRTSAMIAGRHLIVLARHDEGRWAVRAFEPPTAMAQR